MNLWIDDHACDESGLINPHKPLCGWGGLSQIRVLT